MVEQSTPYESWMDQNHEYKTSKYEDLKKRAVKGSVQRDRESCKKGARGFVSGTLNQFLGQIGIKVRNRAKRIKHLIEITENSSMWI